MAHVFISYKSQDKQYADQIETWLNAADLIAWKAPEGISVGETWVEAIDTAIEGAFAVVVVLTEKSLASQWVIYEWCYALSLGKQVMALKFENVDIGNMHEKLRAKQFGDFTNQNNWSKEHDRLIPELKRLESQYKSTSILVPRNAPAAVKQAAEAIDRPNPIDLNNAMDRLAQSNDPSAQEVLLSSLNHSIRDVRIEAAFRLVRVIQYQGLEVIPAIVEAIQFGDDYKREIGRYLLRHIGSRTVPTLIHYIASEMYWAKGTIREILIEHNTTALPFLEMLMRHDNQAVRYEAVSILSGFKNEIAIPALSNALQDGSVDIRVEAVWGLIGTKSESVITNLYSALHDKSARVRMAVLRGLEKITNAISVSHIKHLLNDESQPEGADYPMRHEAAFVLYRVGTDEAYEAIIPYFVEKLSDTSMEFELYSRRYCDLALEILGRIDTPQSRAALEEWKKQYQES